MQDGTVGNDASKGSATVTTDWANPPKLSDLKEHLQGALDSHGTHVNAIESYIENYNITGSAKRKKVRNRSNVQPRIIMQQAEWRIPSLTEPFVNTPDLVRVNPATHADVEAAKQNQALLNYQYNTKLSKVRLIESIVRTLVVEGTTIIRTGWHYEEGIVEEEQPQFKFVPTQNPQLLQMYMQMQQAMASGQDLGEVDEALQVGFRMSQQAGQPVQAIVTGTKLVEVTKVIKNQPTVEVCDYNSVILDPLCNGVIEDAGFVIFEFDTSLSDLKKQTGRYSNLDAMEIVDSDIIGSPDSTGADVKSFNYKDPASKKFIAHEYWGFWDINNTGKTEAFVCTWVGNTIIRMEKSPFPDKELPFVLIQYIPDIKSSTGIPDGKLIIDNQNIIGAITRGMIDIIGKSATGQKATRADALDLPNKRKLDQGLDVEFSGSVEPERLFHIFKPPEIPQSASLLLQQQHIQAESLTGVKAFASNGVSSASLGETATGIRGALDASSLRETAILRRIAEGIKQVSRKIIAMNGAFLSEEEVVRITDEQFIDVKRDDLAGNFDLELLISTAEADNAKAQELAFMLQTGAANADPDEVRMIRAEIAELRKMPELAKKIRDYKPEPDPMLVKEQELKLQLIEAQIQNELGKANENNANGELDKAKIETEQARANLYNAQADKADLDFVEQESGVTYSRDKEKAQAQAEANQLAKREEFEHKERLAKKTK